MSRNLDNPALKCFSYVVAPGADLFGLSLSGIDLRGAQLKETNFAGCHLITANLQDADLEGCNFQRAMFDGAQLDGASLRNADLNDARLNFYMHDRQHGSALEIDLTGAIISPTSLLYADVGYFKKNSSKLRIAIDFPGHNTREMRERDIFSRVRAIRDVVKAIQEEFPETEVNDGAHLENGPASDDV